MPSCQPRPLAAMGYLLGGRATDGLIEVEKLTIVLLYDEQIRPGHCALRLAGYAGKRVLGAFVSAAPTSASSSRILHFSRSMGHAAIASTLPGPNCFLWAWPWNVKWTAVLGIDNSTFANGYACRSSGPDSDLRMLPRLRGRWSGTGRLCLASGRRPSIAGTSATQCLLAMLSVSVGCHHWQQACGLCRIWTDFHDDRSSGCGNCPTIWWASTTHAGFDFRQRPSVPSSCNGDHTRWPCRSAG